MVVPIFWLIILMANLSYAEDLSLDELKKSALTNNINILCKQQEIAEFKASNSWLNVIKGVSSYNFESDAKFYGVTVSIPLFSYFSSKNGLLLKYKELERVKQEVITVVEGLYYDYCNLKEKLELLSKDAIITKKVLDNINFSKEITEAKRDFQKCCLSLTKLRREIECLQAKIDVATAAVNERESKLDKLKKLCEYNMAKEDDIVKAREDLDGKKGVLFDLLMQKNNLMDELKLSGIDLNIKENFHQMIKDQAVIQAEKNYDISQANFNQIERETKRVGDQLLRVCGYEKFSTPLPSTSGKEPTPAALQLSPPRRGF